MKKLSLLPIFLFLPSLLLAVYAPIPNQAQNRDVNVSISGGVHYDDNVLGTPDNEIESAVYTITPRIEYRTRGSATDQGQQAQTRVRAYYELNARYYEDRPSDDSLYNHEFHARLAHQFSPAVQLLVSDTFSLVDDPESFLQGLLQGNQSHTRNLANFRLNTKPGNKVGLNVKARNMNLGYDDADVADSLDRNETLLGVEVAYLFSQQMSGVLEYRYQDVNYDFQGALKDSDSNFFLVGVDYLASQQTRLSARIGVEDRDRDVGSSDTSFYGQATVRHEYAQQSFVSAGVTYDTRETSQTVQFSDEETFSIFANVQHALTGALYVSASLYYDDAELNQQAAASSITDQTFRAGFGLTYQPTDQLSVIFSYDYDDTESDSFFRREERNRIGIRARYTFGL